MNNVRVLLRPLAPPLAIALAFVLAACGPAPEPPLKGAAIGAPFVLDGSNGKRIDSRAFAGRYRMIYFGYTSCPDVCTPDMQRLMAGLKAFAADDPDRAAKVQPLFITLDPERDTAPVLAQFVRAFHPRLIGLTGTPAEIAAVAKAFAIYYKKQPGSAPDRYLVSHIQMPMLFDPDGKPLALFPVDDPNTDADEATPSAVAAVLDAWIK